MRSAARALVVVALAGAVLGAPAAASASEGSVPPEITAYVTGGGLVDRLEDIYGENGAGEGIPFDDTTTTGPVSRVHHWTEDRLAGVAGAVPTRMVNEWAVPVSIGEEPVGVAIVWINTETELPELAELQPDPDAAVALAEVPDDARLVRDLAWGAWFALADGTLTPLAPGSSGIVEPVPVDEIALVVPFSPPVATPDDPNTGLGFAIAAAVVLLGVIVAALLLPGLRKKTPSLSPGSSPPVE